MRIFNYNKCILKLCWNCFKESGNCKKATWIPISIHLHTNTQTLHIFTQTLNYPGIYSTFTSAESPGRPDVVMRPVKLSVAQQNPWHWFLKIHLIRWGFAHRKRYRTMTVNHPAVTHWTVPAASYSDYANCDRHSLIFPPSDRQTKQT